MLSKKNKEYLRNWLTQRLSELLENAKETAIDMRDINDRLIDEVDQASMESDRGLMLRIKERERKLIVKITDALDRFETGTFGICEECGEEIPERRLMARPVTSLCIECKKKQETAEKVGSINWQLPGHRKSQNQF